MSKYTKSIISFSIFSGIPIVLFFIIGNFVAEPALTTFLPLENMMNQVALILLLTPIAAIIG